MSYAAATDPKDLLAFAGLFVVAGGGLWWSSRRDAASPGRIVAYCTDGSSIGVKNGMVRRRPARGARRRLEVGLGPGHRAEVPVDLRRGDLAFVRVREGREGEAAWVVEGLDREAEPFRLHWGFETADAALAAYRALEEFVASLEAGTPGPAPYLTDREFDERWAMAAAGDVVNDATRA